MPPCLTPHSIGKGGLTREFQLTQHRRQLNHVNRILIPIPTNNSFCTLYIQNGLTAHGEAGPMHYMIRPDVIGPDMHQSSQQLLDVIRLLIIIHTNSHGSIETSSHDM